MRPATRADVRRMQRAAKRAKIAAHLPPILTTGELATLLDVSETQVRRMNLPAVKVGKGRFRYVTEQVLEALKRSAA